MYSRYFPFITFNKTASDVLVATRLNLSAVSARTTNVVFVIAIFTFVKTLPEILILVRKGLLT